ncbi:MAG: hypothetical protein GFH27_549287n18 [Chloroflexi bacterium AL-W]|nr:hypothetical protein [Chloroflexi bacterium AL-W]
MRHFFLMLFLVSSILGAALIGRPPHSSLAAPTSPPVPVPAPTDNETSSDITGVVAEGIHPDSVICRFSMHGDHVHVSSTPPRSASGHGWWVNGNCWATHAVVTVQLQQYYDDGRWRNVGAPGQATVRSGGGAGNRATGCVTCTSNDMTSWRSVIDVDLVGIPDTPGKYTTPSQTIACRH